jgi:hypothetical protein
VEARWIEELGLNGLIRFQCSLQPISRFSYLTLKSYFYIFANMNVP